MFMIIVRNSGKCRSCSDEIESKHRHDYVTCSCGAISVDGGKSYFRHIGNLSDFESTSKTRKMSKDEILDVIAKEQKNLDSGIYSTTYSKKVIQVGKNKILEWYGS
jgi:hypothetical protein